MKMVKFSDIGDVIAGQHIPFEQHDEDDSGTPYITGPADFTDHVPIVTKWTKYPRVFAKSGDVLLTVKGAGCGKSNLGIDAAIGRQLMALRPRKELLDQSYLFAFIRSEEAEIARLGQGATVPGISKGDVEAIAVPFTSLPEQRRIASILDKADDIRRKRRETVERVKFFSHALFAAMFARGINASAHGLPPMHWYSSTVDQIKATRQYSCVGGPFGSDLTANDYVNKPGIPVIRGLNLSDDSPYINEDGFVFVSEDKAKELSKCAAFRGDIIVSQRGARLAGQVGLIAEDSRFPVYLVSQSQMKITVNLATIDPIFLVYYLQSAWAVREMERRMMSTGVPHINLGILKSFPVYIPPMELQHKFQSVWSKHRTLLASFSNGLSESERLFESLVQRAFRGEL